MLDREEAVGDPMAKPSTCFYVLSCANIVTFVVDNSVKVTKVS